MEKSTVKRVSKCIIKAICFLLIGCLLFQGIGYLLVPKRFPYLIQYDAGKLRYYRNEEPNSIDVLIAGTSHPGRGILPMEMYEKYGIKSYNLSTTGQPIEVTYYTLAEALKTQSPKLFIFDVSRIFTDHNSTLLWKYVLDEIPIGKNRALMAAACAEMCEYYNEEQESFYELLFPLMGYHTRWKELSQQDFGIGKNGKDYYGKGGLMTSITGGKSISAEEMNSVLNELLQNTQRIEYEYNQGILTDKCEKDSDSLYHRDISERNIKWLLKIKDLCDKNSIEFLAVKVPSVYLPQSYGSAWTLERCNKIRNLCEQYGFTYYDLLYEADINFDWDKDTLDCGPHLNLYGAQKVSVNLGKYLREHYELPDEHNKRWDEDLILYQTVRKVAQLELEQDFSTYINMLANEYNDSMIFIAVSDEMTAGLSDTDKASLRALGLCTDFSQAYRSSYIAVIDGGEVTYEAVSNRGLHYNGTCTNSKINYSLQSDGWWTGSKASIKLGEKEYVVGSRGVHIVVYDDTRGLVLDSVNFDTCAGNSMPVRNNVMVNQMREEFESYIMEVENR